MRGTDLLALADSLERIERECKQARMALNAVIAGQNHRIEGVTETGTTVPQMGTPCHDPDFAALTHTCAIPEEIVERVADCGE